MRDVNEHIKNLYLPDTVTRKMHSGFEKYQLFLTDILNLQNTADRLYAADNVTLYLKPGNQTDY